MKRREFITPIAGTLVASRGAQHGDWMRGIAVRVIAIAVLLQTWTIAWADTAAVPADYKFVDELISDLGFQPSDLIERVRYLAGIPSEAPTQNRLSYCVQGYAERISTDAKLREEVATEVEKRTCAQLGLCRERGMQTDQSSLYAELLHVLAGEMRGEKSADTSRAFQEHESFVEFGRHLARADGIEDTFRRASYVSGQVSAGHIRNSCPSSWNIWPLLISALMGICVLGGILALVYNRTTVKAAST